MGEKLMEKQLFIPDVVVISELAENDGKYNKRIEKILGKISDYKKDFKTIKMSQEEIDLLFKKGYEIKEKYLVLTVNNGNPVKKCPGTQNYLCCNYYTINLYVNCNLGCHYCFLQFYLKNPVVTIFLNIEEMFKQFEELLKTIKIKRIGTGDISDYLLLDPYTDFALDFIDFFKQFQKLTLNLKLKQIILIIS